MRARQPQKPGCGSAAEGLWRIDFAKTACEAKSTNSWYRQDAWLWHLSRRNKRLFTPSSISCRARVRVLHRMGDFRKRNFIARGQVFAPLTSRKWHEQTCLRFGSGRAEFAAFSTLDEDILRASHEDRPTLKSLRLLWQGIGARISLVSSARVCEFST